MYVRGVIELDLQINPSERIVGEGLDDVAEDLATPGRMTMKTAAAKLASEPLQAKPIAPPPAAIKAARLVVSSPKKFRMAMTRTMLSTAPTALCT
jgi:hypothetical protein